jgi:hypothetical protein
MKMGNLKQKGKRLELLQRADEEINLRLDEFHDCGSDVFRRNSTARNSLMYSSRISMCQKNGEKSCSQVKLQRCKTKEEKTLTKYKPIIQVLAAEE